jgi:hypothetical protein
LAPAEELLLIIHPDKESLPLKADYQRRDAPTVMDAQRHTARGIR